MRIIVIGATGTIGRPLCAELERRHEVVAAGRSGRHVTVDIRSADGIEKMFDTVGPVDACVCVAESGALDKFDELTEAALLDNMRGKLFGQINLVLIGRHHLSPRGSFTLTSGIFADEAWPGVTGGAADGFAPLIWPLRLHLQFSASRLVFVASAEHELQSLQSPDSIVSAFIARPYRGRNEQGGMFAARFGSRNLRRLPRKLSSSEPAARLISG